MKQILLLGLMLGTPAAAECTADKQVESLALTMYHEARGEGLDAQQLVGEVVLNRVESPSFPDTICGVVYQKYQFTWVKKLSNHTPKELEVWESTLILAEDMINYEFEPLLEEKATHFLNPKELDTLPTWAVKFEVIGHYGNHTFYSDGSI